MKNEKPKAYKSTNGKNGHKISSSPNFQISLKDWISYRRLAHFFFAMLLFWFFMSITGYTRFLTTGNTRLSFNSQKLSFHNLVQRALSYEFIHGREPEVWLEGRPLMGLSSRAVSRLKFLVSEIRKDNRVLSCSVDNSMPMNKNISSVFIASNLHDSRDILPNFIVQISQFVTRNPSLNIFVSVYESGSTDDTDFWLTLLRLLLDDLGVKNRIVANGTESRQPKQQRIDFLSKVRNRAIEPMWNEDGTMGDWQRLIFINDVYFCGTDLNRLLLYDNADIACGMDFVSTEISIAQSKEQFKDTAKEDLTKKLYYLERAITDEDMTRLKLKNMSGNKWQQARMKKNKPLSLAHSIFMFYDIWVTHDLAGSHFTNMPPYVHSDTNSSERLSKGLPIPVQCCWNGVASLNTQPFSSGVKFRSNYPDECSTSECVLMCYDFQRLGYNHAVLDPSIRTAYTYDVASKVRTEKTSELPMMTWGQVLKSPQLEMQEFKFNHTVDCCPLKPNNEMVNFDECYKWNMWSFNSTSNFSITV